MPDMGGMGDDVAPVTKPSKYSTSLSEKNREALHLKGLNTQLALQSGTIKIHFAKTM